MLLGVLGFIGSGKGTVGDILSQEYGFEQISFATHLKDVASVLFGWNRELLEGDTNESRQFRQQPDNFWSEKFNKPFTPRLALQLLGTESVRNVFHEDFWIHALENKLQKINNKNIVITDVRFKNEIDWMFSKSAILIEVRRGIKPTWYNLAAEANRGSKRAEKFMLDESGVHESEWRWIGHNIHHVIDNDSDLDNLKEKLACCLQKYGLRDKI
jgi:hypothetical protein